MRLIFIKRQIEIGEFLRNHAQGFAFRVQAPNFFIFPVNERRALSPRKSVRVKKLGRSSVVVLFRLKSRRRIAMSEIVRVPGFKIFPRRIRVFNVFKSLLGEPGVPFFLKGFESPLINDFVLFSCRLFAEREILLFLHGEKERHFRLSFCRLRLV